MKEIIFNGAYGKKNGVDNDYQGNFDLINKRKKNFDDDFNNVPPVKSSIDEIDGKLRIFSSSQLGSDRAVVKLDKEMPEVYVAIKSIDINPGEKILMPNADNGVVGLILSITNPSAEFLLYEKDLKKRMLIQKNIRSSFDFPKNINLINETQVNETIKGGLMDKVIFNGLNLSSSSKSLFINDVNCYQNSLKIGGNFYLISKTSCGADSHQRILEDIFDQNSEIVGRGNGGHKIFKINKTKEIENVATITKQDIDFDINGTHFVFETEDALFSKKDIDKGTRILLESVDLTSFKSMLDLGCGWGPIGIVAGISNPDGNVVMIDNNQRAIDVTNDNINKMNLNDRVKAIQSDNIKDNLQGKFDLVLSNPPFHVKTEELIELFNQVKEKMENRGTIYLVVENNYKSKFEDVLLNSFGHYQLKNNGENNYWIISAKK